MSTTKQADFPSIARLSEMARAERDLCCYCADKAQEEKRKALRASKRGDRDAAARYRANAEKFLKKYQESSDALAILGPALGRCVGYTATRDQLDAASLRCLEELEKVTGQRFERIEQTRSMQEQDVLAREFFSGVTEG